MRLEGDAEARLIIEAGLRFGELVALVLEHALEHVPLEDCLLAFSGTRGLLGQQAEEHAVVLHEQRVATGEHRQGSNRRFGSDRHREACRLTLDRGLAQGCHLADDDGHGGRAGDRLSNGRIPRRNDRPPGACDLHRRFGEGLPERLGSTVGRRDERLAEVERRGALLEPSQGLRRHERHEVGQSRRECEQTRDRTSTRLDRLAGRGGRACRCPRPGQSRRRGPCRSPRSTGACSHSRPGCVRPVPAGLRQRSRRTRNSRRPAPS